ncbi:MAG TPA: tetratricopeptide repeat protein [Verrucomicrobiae bacterium]|nr:tetratricopeptide repeat protein [Verrucomicrobiae bacterium]
MSPTVRIVLGATVTVVSAVLTAWGIYQLIQRSYDPAKVIFKIASTISIAFFSLWLALRMGPYGPFVIVFMGLGLSIMWTPHLAEFFSKPLTDLFDGGNEPPDPKPYYSVSITRRKLGKPLEAVAAVREQLAKFPNDYEGILLLAGIQAEDLKDLSAAEISLNHFCEWKGAPPKQVSAALMLLADWHLKINQDTGSARGALERIVEKYPDTEMALVAKQRIGHLSGVEKIMLEAHDRQPTAVPEGVPSPGLLDSMHHLAPAGIDPGELAQVYVKQLEQHPDDTEVREKLAVLYAEHYHRLDLAAIELSQLINQAHQPPKRVAHWLNLLADLQVHAGADYDTVRATLEQIINRFPGLPFAAVAQSRLGRLKLEIKGQQEKTPGVKLGVYEQNIGLKYGPTYGSPR